MFHSGSLSCNETHCGSQHVMGANAAHELPSDQHWSSLTPYLGFLDHVQLKTYGSSLVLTNISSWLLSLMSRHIVFSLQRLHDLNLNHQRWKYQCVHGLTNMKEFPAASPDKETQSEQSRHLLPKTVPCECAKERTTILRLKQCRSNPLIKDNSSPSNRQTTRDEMRRTMP